MSRLTRRKVLKATALTALAAGTGAEGMLGAAEGTMAAQTGGEEALRLWYRQPAAQWVEALPVGNGRLGAMVFGGVEKERLQLNEDTLWAGGPYDPNNPEALAALPEVRQLIFAGKQGEAQRLAGEKMMARPLRQMPYQTVGDVLLTFPGTEDFTDYRRELNLDTAEPFRRNRVAACPSLRLVHRFRKGPARPRRLRGRHCLAERQDGKRHDSQHPGHERQGALW